MSTQESERLGGEAPIRITARGPVNGAEPARSRVPAVSIELVVFAVGVIAVLIAAAVDSGLGATRAWTLITVLAAAFILRRR